MEVPTGDVMTTPTVVALLLAGGRGERASQGGPKQLARLGNLTMLEHVFAAFDEHPNVHRVIVTMPADLVEAATASMPCATIVAGGETRQQSAVAGLEEIGDDEALVLIHDVARPFVSGAIIDRCLEALLTHDAVGTVVDSVDTVYRVQSGDRGTELIDIPDRGSIRRAQTPQGFRCGVIRDAHRLAAEADDDATDDCSVVLRHRPDVRIALVAGDERNVKLTTAADFAGARRDIDIAR